MDYEAQPLPPPTRGLTTLYSFGRGNTSDFRVEQRLSTGRKTVLSVRVLVPEADQPDAPLFQTEAQL
jgi:hypothetical protein